MDQTKLHSAIAALAKFRGTKEPKDTYLDTISNCITSAVKMLSHCEDLKAKLGATDKVTMQFIYASLYVLGKLNDYCKDDSCGNLISVQQQQKIKILLQMIFSIGILPSLVRGVDIALANKTVQLDLFDLEDWSLVESYSMMREIVRALMHILKSPNMRSLILIHLGDLMAALLQLIHIGDIKKPVKGVEYAEALVKKCAKHQIGEGGNSPKSSFVMTEEWHDKLVQDRIEFRTAYSDLVGDIYKPLVIRELLVLLAPVRFADGGKDLSPPLWLRRAVSQQLSDYLTSPGGVSLIMRAMCDSSSDNVDWKKVDAIAKLISTVHGNLTPDEFFSLISPQIISLLNTTGPYCIPVAKKCIRNIYQQNSDICNKYIFDKLLEPFILCSKPVNENFDGTLISEDSLSRCIDHINKCFTPGSRESALPFKALIKIIKIKFKLYSKVSGSLYAHQLAIQDLLVRFLHDEDDVRKLTHYYNALIFNEPHQDMLEMNEALEFEFGPTGGVQVVTKKPQASAEVHVELTAEVNGDFVLDLVSQNDEYSRKLLYGLFVVMLSAMKTACFEDTLTPPEENTDLLDTGDFILYMMNKSQKKLVTIKLLAVLAEHVCVIDEIQEAPELVLGFLETLLEKKAELLTVPKDGGGENGECSQEGESSHSRNGKHAEQAEAEDQSDHSEGDEGEDLEDWELDEEEEERDLVEDLVVILGIVDIITMNMKPGSDKWAVFRPMLDSFKAIKDHASDEFVRFLGGLLHERVLTYGAVSGSMKAQYKEMKKAKEKQQTHVKRQTKIKKRLIVELPEEKAGKKSELEKTVNELCSEDIPTKGHALIHLTKLIHKSKAEVAGRQQILLTMLKHNLRHSDSYIYLAVINALEALAAVDATIVLEALAEEYNSDEDNNPELKMKVGEALVRVTRMLGEVVPKYKYLLVNTFLRGTRSDDEYLRASSLSNLGEVLKTLGYSVGYIIHEVYVCVESIASHDPSAIVRRAAVLVAQLLLKGVSDSTFMVMEPVIRDLYRTLIHIYKSDKDDVTRLHAELALAEVDWLVRDCLTKTKKMEKRIKVLDIPH